MANKDDHLTYYREFFENFAKTVNPNDQLPVKLGSYKLVNLEVIGGVIDWTTQYLNQKKCPPCLIAPLIQLVIQEIRKSCKKEPIACGFNSAESAYEPLKLMQTVMARTNEICLRYLDNSMLCSLPSPGTPFNLVCASAEKNKRKGMEDRHVVVHDLNTMMSIQEASPSSYYGIFDGHAGHNAAAYSAAHLHQFLAESQFFISDPKQALIEAFKKTDDLFCQKCKVESISSGTTAVCALLRPKEKLLYIAWVGDSQAILVNKGKVLQCVEPHKPSREDERTRIENAGGYVCFWGMWRVNGQLAVSRAIGDVDYKPYVTAVPDIHEIPLDGHEDFLILACDGLWDYLTEDQVANTVYYMIYENCDKTDLISERLVQLSKQHGSIDNISVIVVFLREPSKIAAEAHWANRNLTMDATSIDNANNPFSNGDNNILSQKTTQSSDGLLLNLSDNFKQNVTADLTSTDFMFAPSAPPVLEKSNGTHSDASKFDEDDLGPETDVDAVDDVVVSPSILAAKALADGIVNLDKNDAFNPFVDNQSGLEKISFELDLNLLKQQSSEYDVQRSPREETPTPPAEKVHDGGLDENVADSGEESDEEEWNYIAGEKANKENTNPTYPQSGTVIIGEQVANVEAGVEEDDDDDSMSQLNPNAAEFVPVSPTRSIPSPVCRALINEEVIAESPKRPTEIDIKLPKLEDFENEVKSRPSDFNNCKNGHEDEETSDSELMELNGKDDDDDDEIAEHLQRSTPVKTPLASVGMDEFHFGPNAAPFTSGSKLLDQSEAASTGGNYGDDTNALFDLSINSSPLSGDNIDFSQYKSKEEQNPMSMSFYQEKDEDAFDLNKVQIIPDKIGDLQLKQEDQFISNLSKQDTSANLEQKEGNALFLNNDELIVETTDLDKNVDDDEKELASPSPQHDNNDDLLSGIVELPKTPQPPKEEIDLIENLPDLCPTLPVVEGQIGDLLSISSPKPETIESIIEIQEEIEKVAYEEPEKPKTIDLLEPIIDAEKLESPCEDSTEPIKDSPVASSLQELVEEDIAIKNDSFDSVHTPTSPQEASFEFIDNNQTPKSISTTAVNSILDRSEIVDPLSPLDEPIILNESQEEQYEIKTDFIRPELNETVIANETVIEKTLINIDENETKMETIAAPIVAAVAVGATAAAATKTSPTKKTAAKKATTTTATKPASPRTSSNKPTASVPPRFPAKPTSTTGAIPKTFSSSSARPAPKPRTTTGTLTARTAIEKKPLTNGDLKTTARSALTARKTVESKLSSKNVTTTTSSRSHSETTTSTLRANPSKPATITRAAAPITKSSIAPRSKPLPSVGATTSAKTTTTTTTTKSSASRPISAPAKPRVPLTKTLTKTDNEKQSKDVANKLTASRTATSSRTVTGTSSTRTVTSTTSNVKKTEVKASGATRTVSSKTTNSSKLSSATNTNKKPVETKTKVTKIDKPVLNGVPSTVTEELTIAKNALNERENNDVLVKDNSPVDNKLIVETNVAD